MTMIMPKFNFPQPKIPEPILRPNPIHETNRILNDQNEKIDDLSNKLEEADLELANQTRELQSIRYENMKLNAQIDTLNKTIDSQNNELEYLRSINAELKISNKILETNAKSNKHYWRNTTLISLGVGIITFILGIFATEVKALLLLILGLLR